MVEGFGFGCLGKGRIAVRAIAVGKAELPGSRGYDGAFRVPKGGCEAGERVVTDVEHGLVDEKQSSEGTSPQFGLASLRG